MKTIMAIITLNAAATIAAAAGTSGYAYCPHNGHYYKAVHVPEGISWSQAKAEAEKAGGYLATITSKEENMFLYRLVDRAELWQSLDSHGNFGPWIGGLQEKGAREPDQGWKWITGEEFIFTRWAAMEPSGRWEGKDENRLHFYCNNSQTRFTKWNDALDSPADVTIRSYVVEKGAAEAEPVKTMITEPIDEFHDFISANGKASRGRILAYNPSSDIVTIEAENKRSHKTNLDQLSEADRAYVRDWYLVKEFYSESRLRISAKQEEFGEGRDIKLPGSQGGQRALQTMENTGYVVTLENRASADLSNVTADYCIFYEQTRPTARGMVTDQGIECGSLEIGTLAAKAKVQTETEAVTLAKRERTADFGDGKAFKGEIHGIWMRVYLPLSNGQRAMREYASPKNIAHDKEWATSDVSALPQNFLRQNMGGR